MKNEAEEKIKNLAVEAFEFLAEHPEFLNSKMPDIIFDEFPILRLVRAAVKVKKLIESIGSWTTLVEHKGWKLQQRANGEKFLIRDGNGKAQAAGSADEIAKTLENIIEYSKNYGKFRCNE